jgi:hypothetical protein
MFRRRSLERYGRWRIGARLERAIEDSRAFNLINRAGRWYA